MSDNPFQNQSNEGQTENVNTGILGNQTETGVPGNKRDDSVANENQNIAGIVNDDVQNDKRSVEDNRENLDKDQEERDLLANYGHIADKEVARRLAEADKKSQAGTSHPLVKQLEEIVSELEKKQPTTSLNQDALSHLRLATEMVKQDVINSNTQDFIDTPEGTKKTEIAEEKLRDSVSEEEVEEANR